MKFVACLVISCVSLLVTRDKRSLVNSTPTLWNEGKVPYEISKQFVSSESTVIKQALIEIMKTTCIKFVPRFYEPDFAVFMKYKHPTQKRGTCWSGKWKNYGTNRTIGNQKGRHIVSLWPDLDYCFSTWVIIREILNLLGIQTKPTSSPINGVNKYGKHIINMYFNYEENLAEVPKHFFGNSCRTDSNIIKNHVFALDKNEMVLASKRDSCRTMVCNCYKGAVTAVTLKNKQVIQINQVYNCGANSTSGNKVVGVSTLVSVSPSCKAEVKAASCKSDPVYMNAVCEKLSQSEQFLCEGASYLMNLNGKCLAAPKDESHIIGNLLNSWNFGFPENGQLWSWNETTLGSGDRHLCNGHNKCVSSVNKSGTSIDLVQSEHLNETSQRFTIFNMATDGFFMIKNDYGKCIGLEKNNRFAWAVDCKKYEKGQYWKWHRAL